MLDGLFIDVDLSWIHLEITSFLHTVNESSVFRGLEERTGHCYLERVDTEVVLSVRASSVSFLRGHDRQWGSNLVETAQSSVFGVIEHQSFLCLLQNPGDGPWVHGLLPVYKFQCVLGTETLLKEVYSRPQTVVCSFGVLSDTQFLPHGPGVRFGGSSLRDPHLGPWDTTCRSDTGTTDECRRHTTSYLPGRRKVVVGWTNLTS